MSRYTETVVDLKIFEFVDVSGVYLASHGVLTLHQHMIPVV